MSRVAFPKHDGVWDADFMDNSYPDIGELMNSAELGEVIEVEPYVVLPRLWGFHTYENVGLVQHWYNNRAEAEAALKEIMEREEREES